MDADAAAGGPVRRLRTRRRAQLGPRVVCPGCGRQSAAACAELSRERAVGDAVTGETLEKHRRLTAVLDAERLDSLVLRRPGNVAWYSGGGRTHIVATPDVGVADVVVRRDGVEVVTAVNEAPRLEVEELSGLDASFRVLPWDADREPALPSGPEVGALTATCLRLTPETSEFEAAALMSSELHARGADAIVLLVAGASRLPQHRHPLPTDAQLGRLTMLVACARRGGLIANLTRFVSFGPLRSEEQDAFDRLLHVDTAFNNATVPGRTVGDVFAAGIAGYAANGFGADEWRLHHQGGPTGYEGRDYVANAESAARVEPAQAFAWNPSVPSLKSEDTVVAGTAAPEILTADADWPAREVDGLRRPLVLER
ncbi:MAG: M24 family metallopeptidase, partial [Acidobacteria bacterium]|nr:M24 family metallopeptidase [Acidobacteriota bacterium]